MRHFADAALRWGFHFFIRLAFGSFMSSYRQAMASIMAYQHKSAAAKAHREPAPAASAAPCPGEYINKMLSRSLAADNRPPTIRLDTHQHEATPPMASGGRMTLRRSRALGALYRLDIAGGDDAAASSYHLASS